MISWAEEGWQRLHPLTVLKELASLAWTLVVLFFIDFEPISGPDDMIGPEALAAAGVFVYAVTRYLFTAYRITDRALELRRGVFVKSFQVMPRDRVQSVGTNTSFLGRIVGVTTVEVSAADAEDIHLSFVSEESGEALRRILEVSRPRPDGAEEEPERIPVASMDPGRIVAYGLTDSFLIPSLLLLITGVVLSLMIRWFAASLPVAFLLFIPVVRTVQLVGFRSWVEEDRLRAEAGILGRRRSESPLDRIQVIQATRPPIRRLAGKETVTVATGDVGVSGEGAEIAGMVAPLEPIGAWREVSDKLIGHVALGEANLNPSSLRTIRRTVVRGTGLVVLLSGVAAVVSGLFDLGWWLPVTLAAAGLLVTVGYARARWRVLGWAVDEDHLLVRRGVLLRRLTVVPVRKVQDVTVRATFFQRRLDIATVEVDTAGVMLAGRVIAVDLETPDASRLAERLADKAARIALPDGV